MSKFTYWKGGEFLCHEYHNDEELTVEEAQVIATMKVAENLQSISSELSELMYFLRNHSVQVEIKDK